jgi:hypothetical protein
VVAFRPDIEAGRVEEDGVEDHNEDSGDAIDIEVRRAPIVSLRIEVPHIG